MNYLEIHVINAGDEQSTRTPGPSRNRKRTARKRIEFSLDEDQFSTFEKRRQGSNLTKTSFAIDCCLGMIHRDHHVDITEVIKELSRLQMILEAFLDGVPNHASVLKPLTTGLNNLQLRMIGAGALDDH